jgi:hypothetical protein
MILNERIKLTATYLNGCAIACIAIGGLAPVASVIVNGSQVSAFRLFALALGCLCISFALHLAGRRILRRLE